MKVIWAFKGKKPYPIHIPFIPISHPVKQREKQWKTIIFLVNFSYLNNKCSLDDTWSIFSLHPSLRQNTTLRAEVNFSVAQRLAFMKSFESFVCHVVGFFYMPQEKSSPGAYKTSQQCNWQVTWTIDFINAKHPSREKPLLAG